MFFSGSRLRLWMTVLLLSRCTLCIWIQIGPVTWTSWSDCSVTCGQGNQFRICNNCAVDMTETRPCEIQGCQVDGQWSLWIAFGPCSSSCGDGFRSRTRTCTNPVPANGGQDCSGNGTETSYCKVSDCSFATDSPVYSLAIPVDGGWSIWSSYGPCSVTCGSGVKFKNRSCSNPIPANGGMDCPGNSIFIAPCNLENCTDAVIPGCDCACVDENITLEKRIENILTNLQIPKTKLLTFKRKLISAHDDRKSAAIVGNLGIVVLGIVGLIIVSSDIHSFLYTHRRS